MSATREQADGSGHVAVVLAAGGSRRLGRPKQLLTRDGESLLRRTVFLAQSTAPVRTLVVLGAEHKRLSDSLRGLDCQCVVNPDWQSGIAGSLATAAVAMSGHDGSVLIVGCDQPALSSEHLHALLRGAASASSRSAATLHGLLPGVPAVVPARWLQDIRHGDGDRGLGPRLRSLSPDQLFVLDAPELQFDVDTEADVVAAINRGWLDAEDVG